MCLVPRFLKNKNIGLHFATDSSSSSTITYSILNCRSSIQKILNFFLPLITILETSGEQESHREIYINQVICFKAWYALYLSVAEENCFKLPQNKQTKLSRKNIPILSLFCFFLFLTLIRQSK